MFKPVDMQKVRIIGVRSILPALIKSLHEAGLIEIKVREYSRFGLESGRPLDVFNDISEQLVRIRAIERMLPKREAKPEPMEGMTALKEAKAITLDKELKSLLDERTRLEADIRRISGELKVIKGLKNFGDVDFSKLETNTLSYVVGSVLAEKLNYCKKKLDKVVKHYNLRCAESDIPGKLNCVIVYKKGNYDVADLLEEYGFVRIAIPASATTPYATEAAFSKELEEKQKRLTEITATLSSLSDRYYQKVISLERALSIEADRAEIAARFGFTEHVFILEGWIKERDFGLLERLVEKAAQKNAIVERIEETPDEIPPTVLENPEYSKQFQFITESFSLPHAREFDPTMAYFISLPLFYGMIVGDVIYGIISILLSLFFLKKFKHPMVVNGAKIWLFSAFPAIIFGIIFDEWAGMSHFEMLSFLGEWGLPLRAIGITGPLYTGLSRLHNLPELLVITVFTGLIHLAVGFLIGAMNEWHHNKKHAIAKLSWIGVEVGGTIAIATFFFNALPLTAGWVGTAIFVLSVGIIVFTEGVIGILEVPGLMGNVLSYTRIAAVGMSGVMLALVINMFLKPVPAHGILVLLLLPLYIIFHALNTLIAMFEAVIQGGRLNIVEFRSKFLEGGGKFFEPFALTK